MAAGPIVVGNISTLESTDFWTRLLILTKTKIGSTIFDVRFKISDISPKNSDELAADPLAYNYVDEADDVRWQAGRNTDTRRNFNDVGLTSKLAIPSRKEGTATSLLWLVASVSTHGRRGG
jgi:hypothetical protein